MAGVFGERQKYIGLLHSFKNQNISHLIISGVSKCDIVHETTQFNFLMVARKLRSCQKIGLMTKYKFSML